MFLWASSPCLEIGSGTFRLGKSRSLTCGANRRRVSSLGSIDSLGATLGIALTRERGKNSKLATLVRRRLPEARIYELPCIAHKVRTDADRIVQLLASDADSIDWILITSPTAAEVFAQVVRSAQERGLQRLPPIASVGAATNTALLKYSMQANFIPSRAIGACLGDELPVEKLPKVRILYPTSASASDEIEKRLRSRVPAVEFIRIDMYDTIEAKWTTEDIDTARNSVDLVTLASPSAVKVWAQRVGTKQPAVCIGKTSADAAKEVGFSEVYAPSDPGLEAWVDTLVRVFEQKRTETRG